MSEKLGPTGEWRPLLSDHDLTRGDLTTDEIWSEAPFLCDPNEPESELQLRIWAGDEDDGNRLQLVIYGLDVAIGYVLLDDFLAANFTDSTGAGPEDEIAALTKLRNTVDTLIKAREQEIAFLENAPNA